MKRFPILTAALATQAGILGASAQQTTSPPAGSQGVLSGRFSKPKESAPMSGRTYYLVDPAKPAPKPAVTAAPPAEVKKTSVKQQPAAVKALPLLPPAAKAENKKDSRKQVADARVKPIPAPTPASTATAAPLAEDKKKPSRGLFGFFAGNEDAPTPKIASEVPPAKPAVKKAEVKPPMVAKVAAAPAPAKPVTKPEVEEKKASKGFFGLFKGDSEETPAKTDPKLQAQKSTKPAPTTLPPAVPAVADKNKKPETVAPVTDVAKEEPKKPGLFARLFGGPVPGRSERKIDKDDLPPRPADWESKYIVKDDNVKAYVYGPSQSGGADERLARGTILTLKKSSRAWAEIVVDGGRAYTVGADQIRKAEITDFAPPAVIASTNAAGIPIGPELPYYETIPAPNLPDAPGKPGLELPDLLLPPTPPTPVAPAPPAPPAAVDPAISPPAETTPPAQ